MSFHFSNTLLGFINFLTFLFSIPIIIVGVLVTKSSVTECGLSSDKALIGIGVAIMIVSLASFGILILILLGLGFSGFSYAVSRKGTAETLPGKGYKEYKLEKYSIVIQKAINETQNWNDIKSCIVDSKICSSYENKYHNDTVQMFFKESIESYSAIL
ncbi:hypothetical protein PVK06_043882 [Gossypium arboreum]|uniref:Uncharacterized protein n=1 Tax=Gossypium arboreum TaxID=29729 RepID=A0ABR0MPL4_GOSAR|nr:hypothetical protein PVK06_043882 [Gossypium arboreum]